MKKIGMYFLIAMFGFGLVGCSTNEMVTREDAEKTALGEVDGTVNTYTEKFDDDEPHHLFDVVKDGKHYEVKVHRETGEIISSKVITDEKTTEDDTTNNYISEDDAKKIAMDEVGGGNVIETKLEGTSMDKVYKVKIHHNNKEYTVKVDALTKKVKDVEENEID